MTSWPFGPIWTHLDPFVTTFLNPRFCAGIADGKVPQMEAGKDSKADVPQEPEVRVLLRSDVNVCMFFMK